MTLFKASRLLTSTPLDAVEDENHGDAPTEEDEARDNQIYQVEALAAVLSDFEANARDFTPQKSAWESIRPGYAQRTIYTFGVTSIALFCFDVSDQVMHKERFTLTSRKL